MKKWFSIVLNCGACFFFRLTATSATEAAAKAATETTAIAAAETATEASAEATAVAAASETTKATKATCLNWFNCDLINYTSK